MATPTLQEILALEQELIAQGWTRQFTVFPDRVSEFIDLYEKAGHQVRVEPWALTANADPSCDSCALIGYMRTIYTRKQSDNVGGQHGSQH